MPDPRPTVHTGGGRTTVVQNIGGGSMTTVVSGGTVVMGSGNVVVGSGSVNVVQGTSGAVRVELQVPDGTDAGVAAQHGAIILTGALGRVDADAEHSSVTADHLGDDAEIRANHGQVRAHTEANEHVSATANHGNVQVTTGAGVDPRKVHASASHGSAVVR